MFAFRVINNRKEELETVYTLNDRGWKKGQFEYFPESRVYGQPVTVWRAA